MTRRYQRSTFSGPTRATILKSTTRGWFDIQTPYNEDFVSQLKALIQPASRKWNPDVKLWSVSEAYLEDVVNLLKVHYDEVVANIGQESTGSIAAPKVTNTFKLVFETVKDMPNSNIDKLYMTLANAVHPDHGGTNDLMRQLNEAYQEVKK